MLLIIDKECCMSKRTLGFIAVLVTVTGYSFFSIFTKFALADGLRPTDVVFWRFALAACFIWSTYPVWHKRLSYKNMTRRQFVDAMQLGAMFAIPAICAAFALESIPASTYTLIMYMYPATIALASLALGEYLNTTMCVAILLAVGGSSLTIGGQLVVNNPIDLVYPLINMVSYAGYILLSQYKARGLSRMTLATITISTTFVVITPVALLNGVMPPATLQGWLSVSGLSVISTIVPITALLVGVSMVGAALASVMAAFEPVLTLVWAAFLLDERIGPIQYIGGALIIISVVLLNLPERIRKNIRQILTRRRDGTIPPPVDRSA